MSEASFPTMKEAKAARVRLLARGLEDLRPVLATYGRSHNGRFLLFGSAARGELRYDSDVDLLVDFLAAALDDAWRFAEDACWRFGLTPDIRPLSWCGSRFLDHVLPGAVVLQ